MSFELAEKTDIEQILEQLKEMKEEQKKIAYMCDHMSRILDAWVKGRLGDRNPLDEQFGEGWEEEQS